MTTMTHTHLIFKEFDACSLIAEKQTHSDFTEVWIRTLSSLIYALTIQNIDPH